MPKFKVQCSRSMRMTCTVVVDADDAESARLVVGHRDFADEAFDWHTGGMLDDFEVEEAEEIKEPQTGTATD